MKRLTKRLTVHFQSFEKLTLITSASFLTIALVEGNLRKSSLCLFHVCHLVALVPIVSVRIRFIHM